MPHEPQFFASLVVSAQVLPHLVSPLPQEQDPATQVPPPHETSQAPQWPASVALSTQTPKQTSVLPTGQTHLLAVQVAPTGHLLKQAPQLSKSLVLSVQTTPHMSGLATGQVQTPLAQLAPVGHFLAQAPQLFTSVDTSVQPIPGQRIIPVPHAQTPDLQVPLPQVVPHFPQFFASLVKSTHVPGAGPQIVGVADGQAEHTPLAQVAPTGHALPHAPQLEVSDETSTQEAPHVILGLGQTHALETQLCPGAHFLSQSPQFAGSAVTSTHPALQVFFGGSQLGTSVGPSGGGAVSAVVSVLLSGVVLSVVVVVSGGGEEVSADESTSVSPGSPVTSTEPPQATAEMTTQRATGRSRRARKEEDMLASSFGGSVRPV